MSNTVYLLSFAAVGILTQQFSTKPVPASIASPKLKLQRQSVPTAVPTARTKAAIPTQGGQTSPKPWGPIPIKPGTLPSPRPSVPMLPPDRVAVNPDALRNNMKLARDRKTMERCRAEGGKWVAEAQGIELGADGPDVDEIYGNIQLFGSAKQEGRFYSTRGGTGWQPNWLWQSYDNVNLGKYPVISGFPRVRHIDIPYHGGITDYVRIIFHVNDEDDGRGGSNDERFLFGDDNVRIFKMHVIPCDMGGEFESIQRIMITARPPRRDTSNRVNFTVRVRAYRLYPDIK